MDLPTLIGSVAAILTTSSFIPQAVKVYRTHHTCDLSLPMYIVFTIGVLLWTLYGILVGSAPIVIANIVTLIISGYILMMKVRYG